MSHPQSMAAFQSPATDHSRMAGHWLLASLGKRVLRPGGVELTHRMLDALAIGERDSVVELAPGLGHTAAKVIGNNPIWYIGVDRDVSAVRRLRDTLGSHNVQFVEGSADHTDLPGEIASVLFGEAMLSMHPHSQKKRIIEEAWRLLKFGGRYGIHELSLLPDGAPDELRRAIEADLSRTIHHGVRPLTPSEWRELLESAGFNVTKEAHAPMHLLERRRMIEDEGLPRTLKIAFNLLRHPEARRRVLAMRKVFRKYSDHIGAVSFVCEKRY